MKKNIKNIIAFGIILAVSGGNVAFANTSAANDLVTISADVDATIKPTLGTEAQKEAESFISTEGKVTEISTATEDGTHVVTITNEQGGLRFSVSPSSNIIDRETGESISASELTEGMVVSVIYSELSPMGMSMPPFLGNATVIVANADKGNYVVGFFDNTLLNEKDQLLLNIGEDTILTHSGKSKIGITPEMIKDKNLLVFYTSTTRSIPAQTTPSFVMLLDSKILIDPNPANETKKDEETPALVPLRAAATAKDYTVTWQGKDNSILVKNIDSLMEITIGKSTYTIDGVEKQATQPAAFIDGLTYVSSDVLNH